MIRPIFQVTIPEGSLATNIQITTKARSSIFGATPEESTLHALYSTPNKEIYIVDPNTNKIQLYTKANQFETELARLNNQYQSEQTQIAKELREGELQAKGSKEQESTPKQPETEQVPCISFRPRDYYKQKQVLVALTPEEKYNNLKAKFLSRPIDTLFGVEEAEASSVCGSPAELKARYEKAKRLNDDVNRKIKSEKNDYSGAKLDFEEKYVWNERDGEYWNHCQDTLDQINRINKNTENLNRSLKLDAQRLTSEERNLVENILAVNSENKELIQSQFPNFTWDQLADKLKSTSSQIKTINEKFKK